MTKSQFELANNLQTAHINFQPLGCNTFPAIPSGRYEKCPFSRIFKNLYLGFQATNFNSATGIFFHEVKVQNFWDTLLCNPYCSLLLKCSKVPSKAVCTQKYAKNQNLKLNTFSDQDLKGFLKSFEMPFDKLNLVK